MKTNTIKMKFNVSSKTNENEDMEDKTANEAPRTLLRDSHQAKAPPIDN